MAENWHPNLMVSADDNKQRGCSSQKLRENRIKRRSMQALSSHMVHTALGGATELSASDIDLMTVPHCHRQTAIKAWHRLDWVDPPQNVQRREKLEQDL
jgi:hypothetical protein